MKRNSALCALAVVVLTGSMAVAALADDHEMNAYGPADSSVSAQPQEDVYSSDAGEIREPMETGSVPESRGGLSEDFKMDTGDEPTVEFGGQTFRPDIDSGP